MVTHAHDLVRRFDNRVIVLDGGEIVADGAVEKTGISISPVKPLNVEKTETFENRITQRFVERPQETPAEVPSTNENPDEEFLNAIVSDTDTYRVYVEEDGAAPAENKEGGDAQ
jgi:ABC-type methionine transport system ATPase subunit